MSAEYDHTNAQAIDHPLVSHHLATLRSSEASSHAFRTAMRQLTTLLACQATSQLHTTTKIVTTPLTTTPCEVVSQSVGLVPILRAGLGMVDPILDLIPQAEVWHLGFYRDEETATPVHYYSNLPTDHVVDVAYILDPMLATGGSAIAAIQHLRDWGATNIRLLSIIAAPEGIRAVQDQHADVSITVCAIDQELNEKKFIVPGLGDAGDRYFATE